MLLVLVRHVKTGGLHVKNDYHSVEWIITHMNKQGFSTAVLELNGRPLVKNE